MDSSFNRQESIGHHGWLWLSISLLVLGQVTSFIYLLQSQQSLLDSFKCSCHPPSSSSATNAEEELFTTSTSSARNSSVSQQDHLAVAQSFLTRDDRLHHETLARKKRSSSSSTKPAKHSKVYYTTLHCTTLSNQVYYSTAT